ncbi:MAG: hypothetical protein ACN4GM_03345 [Gammaproteobacteria bacterium]
MKLKFNIDIILLIIGTLLMLTVTGFVTGWFIYPYGFLLLLIFFAARIAYLAAKNN